MPRRRRGVADFFLEVDFLPEDFTAAAASTIPRPSRALCEELRAVHWIYCDHGDSADALHALAAG
jgi:hypothetical protein